MTDEAREEGFYWVILGQNPPEVAYWVRQPGRVPGIPPGGGFSGLRATRGDVSGT